MSKSARLILGGEFASQNRLGYLIFGRKIYVSNLRKGFTETRIEDLDLCKTQPCKSFVYIDQGNLSQE